MHCVSAVGFTTRFKAGLTAFFAGDFLLCPPVAEKIISD